MTAGDVAAKARLLAKSLSDELGSAEAMVVMMEAVTVLAANMLVMVGHETQARRRALEGLDDYGKNLKFSAIRLEMKAREWQAKKSGNASAEV